MGLGILIKRHGGKIDVVNGRGAIVLTWYESFSEMKDKLQKNFFGIAAGFSLWRALVIAAAMVFVGFAPLGGVAGLAGSWLSLVPFVGVIAMLASVALYARAMGRPQFPSLLAPVGILLIAYMVVRSAIIGTRIGGISWRGTVYPSEMLRRSQRFKMF
jgi:hypothetical protein